MKMRWFVAALAAMALLTAACGGGGTDGDATEAPEPSEVTSEVTSEAPTEDSAAADLELVSEGNLTVCTDAPYFPMEFEDEETGEFTGFDIELMRAIGEQLGLGLEVVNSGFDPITSGTALASGQCDIAAASITITEEREESIDFTDPYFDAEQSLLVKTDGEVSAIDDLAGKRVGVQSGTTGESYANENVPEDTEVVSFENPGDIFVALEAGDIEGVIQDLVVNQGRALEDDSVEVVETYQTDEQYGFAAEEGNTAMTGAVNEVLSTMREDGSYDAIYEEWFGTE